MSLNQPYRVFILPILFACVALLISACAGRNPTLPAEITPTIMTGSEPGEQPADLTPSATASETSSEQPTDTPPGIPTLAFIGQDGNVWVQNSLGEAPRQLTQDAFSNESGLVQYSSLALSSDGRLLAYRREAGTLTEAVMNFQPGLWVADLTTGKSRQLLDQNPAGFAWKPQAHLLTYGLGVQEGYFPARGEVNPALAQGI